jgi:hypothetical protein
MAILKGERIADAGSVLEIKAAIKRLKQYD